MTEAIGTDLATRPAPIVIATSAIPSRAGREQQHER